MKLRRERQKIESRDSMDETYRRFRYVRYADDFLIGVIGSKAEVGTVAGKNIDNKRTNAREISWLRGFRS